jgi:hypothetical protein
VAAVLMEDHLVVVLMEDHLVVVLMEDHLVVVLMVVEKPRRNHSEQVVSTQSSRVANHMVVRALVDLISRNINI